MRSGAALLGAIVAALSLTWVALVPVVFPGTGGSGGAVVLEGKPNARAMQAQIAAMQAGTMASAITKAAPDSCRALAEI